MTFAEFISTNTNIFRELLPSNSRDSFQSSNQTILTLSESFFQKVPQNEIFLEFATNHTDFFRKLLLNTTRYALLNTFRKQMSNQGTLNESKLGKSGQVGSVHCVKSVRIRSYSGPYFPAFRLNTERYSVSLRIKRTVKGAEPWKCDIRLSRIL